MSLPALAATAQQGERLSFTFSLAERDRRYERVRAMMAERGFDALLVPCNTGHNDAFQADVRYLTQVGGFATEAAVVFPSTGAPTCWVRSDSQPAEWWRDMQEWVPDVRGSRCDWSNNFATSLRELELTTGRIGVVGIGGTPRSPDGLINYVTLSRLEEWFPKATFEDATSAMVNVREIKSDEEVSALERAARIAERSVLAGAAVARPGATDAQVYAEIIATMIREGGEIPTLILWGAGASPNRYSRTPTMRPIQAGDVIISEVEAKCAGYIAQVRRPVFVGAPSAEYAHMHAVVVEAFQAMFDLMRPGVPFADLVSAYSELVKARGYRPVAVPLHGRGLGEDLPVIRMDSLSGEVLERRVRAGHVFILGPRIATQDGSKVLQWGDTVVVTEDGARRLGGLPADPLIAKEGPLT
jgi:Xaa-Pro dipeptidase